jgi:thiopeptide-type bacteriocin biosynthesis protein
MVNSKLRYVPGDTWIYYRIYSGHEVADKVLKTILIPFLFDLREKKCIDSWFFIRYADPDRHIRLRLKFSDYCHLTPIMQEINLLLKGHTDSGLIYKLELGTYQPEYERYGRRAMPYVERLFYADSVAYGLFSLSDQNDKETALWLYAIYSADQLLDDFGLQAEEKKALLFRLSRSFGVEFDKDKVLARQLSAKFRKNRLLIGKLITANDGTEMGLQIRKVIHQRSALQKHDVAFINELYNQNETGVEKADLLASLIHMSMNRIFSTNGRMHEMVIYDMLFRYYKSALAYPIGYN